MMANLDAHHERMIACLGKTEATDLEANPRKCSPRRCIRKALRKKPQ
jgi:hypothetical protein